MKVVFLIGTNDLGGAEFVSYHHVMMAHEAGFEVTVVSGTGGYFHDQIRAAGVKIHIVGMGAKTEEIAPFVQQCDVVFNCNFMGVIPAVVPLKKKLGFRHLVILHNNTSWLCGEVRKWDQSIDGYYAIHQKIVDSITGVKGEKFTVIPNCVDTKAIDRTEGMREEVRRQYGYKNDHFVIGMVTRVAGDKNIMDAVRIFRRLPMANTRLLIVGGASENESSRHYFRRVQQLIRGDAATRERVTITGNLSSEGVYRAIRAFDIGFNCSPSEGLPIALLEMMGAGICCVMPSVGDIPGVLTGRGIVVPIRQRHSVREIFKDPCFDQMELVKFVNAIKEVRGNPAERVRLGAEAKWFVQNSRSLEYQKRHFLNFLSMATKKKVEVNKTEESGTGAVVALPKVSVLMPTRDPNPEWIKEAFDSIITQDYKGEIEVVIVVHDCRMSTVRMIEEMVKGCQGDRSTKLVPVVSEASLSEVLDAGLKECSGDIVVRMDHDDIAETGLVSQHVEYMTAHPEVHICGVQIRFFGTRSMVTNHPAVVTKELAYNLPNWWFVNHPGIAMRRETVLSLGGYGKVTHGLAEDYNLWCNFLKAGYNVHNLPDVLVRYRIYSKPSIRPAGHIEFLQRVKATLQ